MESRRSRSGDTTSSSPDARGQMETLGVVLLLGFTVLVGSTIAFTGMSMLQSGQDSTEHQHAENEMAVLASKIAEVGLGDSNLQQASFSSDGGTYEVREDAGTMTIVHANRTTSGSEEEIHEVTLGAVVYENGDTEIAYQGGGVWRKTGDSATMVSPPEFHYRDGTLTLPMMRVTGDSQASGNTDVVVRPGSDTSTIYPSSDDNYSGGDAYTNPVENGTIQVTVESEYYQGWAQYFDERTTGNISVDESKQRVSVDLVTMGDQGETPLHQNKEIVLRGLPEDEPLEMFNLTLVANGHNSANFNNLDWDLDADGETLVNLYKAGSGPTIGVTIMDGDGGEWEVDDPYDTYGSEAYVNLTGERNMTHSETGLKKEIGEVFNQRIEEIGPDVNLEIDEGNVGKGKGSTALEYETEPSTTADIEFDGEGRIITYLQITENEVILEFN